MTQKPLISVITINLNNIEGLKRTIRSVLEQTFKNYEYLVIDGGSNDGSREYIEKHKEQITYWVSEPDEGVYNAMNKGIRAATGKYLLFLNSGDIVNRSETFLDISIDLKADYDIVYGSIYLLDQDGEKNLHVMPPDLPFSFFRHSTIAHQSALIKRTLFNTAGLYDESLQLASDWKFFTDSICKYSASYKKLHTVIAQYSLDGMSSDSQNWKLLNKERKKVLNNEYKAFRLDYEELEKMEKLFQTSHFRTLRDIEEIRFGRKLISLNFSLYSFLLAQKPHTFFKYLLPGRKKGKK